MKFSSYITKMYLFKDSGKINVTSRLFLAFFVFTFTLIYLLQYNGSRIRILRISAIDATFETANSDTSIICTIELVPFNHQKFWNSTEVPIGDSSKLPIASIYTNCFSDEVWDWEQSKSRNACDYVFPDEVTTMTSVSHNCDSENPFLLIIVCSETNHFEQRKAIRETWGMKARRNFIIVLFLVGTDARGELDTEIIEENFKYNDVIVENFIDSNNNSTIKSIMMLKWFDQNCRNAKFIMKVDDDVYINANNLRKLLNLVKDADLENFLIGKLYTKLIPQTESPSKWLIPNFMFVDNTYMYLLSGAGYVMSSEVAQALYRESLKNELVYLEDLYITGICANIVNLNHINNPQFHFFNHPVTVECNSVHSHLILLSHPLSASEMRNQHEQMLKCWREVLVPKWFRND